VGFKSDRLLGPDDDAEVEYGVDQRADDVDVRLREQCRELGEREAARQLGISRTSLRQAMRLGADAMSRAMRGRLAAELGKTR
jgi:ribosomal protein S14